MGLILGRTLISPVEPTASDAEMYKCREEDRY